MQSDNVTDFMTRLKKKQKKMRLEEMLSASGWELNDERLDESEACVYLIDSIVHSIILFGCKKADFIDIDSDDYIHWGHFVAAWDVIADPDLPFDDKHKANTIEFVLRALPGVALWHPILNKVLSETEIKRAHILIIIDRDNTYEPLDIILARSDSLLMNTESIQSIIDNYKDSV